MKCPASENGTCMLVIALGAKCNGYSTECKMRPTVERYNEIGKKALSSMRKALGIRGDL